MSAINSLFAMFVLMAGRSQFTSKKPCSKCSQQHVHNTDCPQHFLHDCHNSWQSSAMFIACQPATKVEQAPILASKARDSLRIAWLRVHISVLSNVYL